jgi:tetratricopeptide (TPR) repeat protein
MNSRSRTAAWTALAVLSACATGFLASAGSVPAATGSPVDKEIPKYQGDLLDVAFRSATAMPIKPHIKTRSKLQQSVVEACLQLDQPLRALSYVEKIDDWRRGMAYAECAFYCAQHGFTAEVPRCLELARQISEKHLKDEDSQDWHLERVRAVMAKTHLLLGQTQEAAQLGAGLSPVESRPLDALRAMQSEPAALERQLEIADRAHEAGNFDQLQGALETCTQFFDRFYGDTERRDRIEAKIKSSWDKLPTMIRIELLEKLAGHALEHRDQAKALQLVNDAGPILEGEQWTPEDRVRLTANLAELRYRAGDEKKARSEADRAVLLFDAARTQIVNIWRAGPEAYRTMGDDAAALKVYKRAVEEGVGNPNSRPRAEDLTATCCSMATHGVEPDETLRSRLVQVSNGLAEPW